MSLVILLFYCYVIAFEIGLGPGLLARAIGVLL